MKNLTVFLLVLIAISTPAIADDRLFELRTYHANDGKLDALHARFRDHTVALFEKHGMTNIGYWVPKAEGNNTLIYLMAYPDREKRDESWKAFMTDPAWKKAYADSTKDGKLVKKVEKLFLKTTDYSPELKVEKTDPERLFELRVYTTNEGKMKDLDARFRDHTVALFEKHGLKNLVYFHPTEGQQAGKNQLVYFITHKDEESRGDGFKAFSGDPDWKAARKKSEENGKILAEKPASSLLTPTDYSPMK